MRYVLVSCYPLAVYHKIIRLKCRNVSIHSLCESEVWSVLSESQVGNMEQLEPQCHLTHASFSWAHESVKQGAQLLATIQPNPLFLSSWSLQITIGQFKSLATRTSLDPITLSWSLKKGPGSFKAVMIKAIPHWNKGTALQRYHMSGTTLHSGLGPYSTAEASCQENRYLGSHLRILWHRIFSSQAVPPFKSQWSLMGRLLG